MAQQLDLPAATGATPSGSAPAADPPSSIAEKVGAAVQPATAESQPAPPDPLEAARAADRRDADQPPPPAERSFTQHQVEELIRGRLDQQKRGYESRLGELEGLRGKLADFESREREREAPANGTGKASFDREIARAREDLAAETFLAKLDLQWSVVQQKLGKLAELPGFREAALEVWRIFPSTSVPEVATELGRRYRAAIAAFNHQEGEQRAALHKAAAGIVPSGGGAGGGAGSGSAGTSRNGATKKPSIADRIGAALARD